MKRSASGEEVVIDVESRQTSPKQVKMDIRLNLHEVDFLIPDVWAIPLPEEIGGELVDEEVCDQIMREMFEITYPERAAWRRLMEESS